MYNMKMGTAAVNGHKTAKNSVLDYAATW